MDLSNKYLVDEIDMMVASETEFLEHVNIY
jgi:hypothetical protein